MLLTCGKCGRKWEKALRGRPPKLCDDCRANPAAPIAPTVRAAPVVPIHQGPQDPPEPQRGPIEDAVHAELAAVGRESTIDGIAALHAAATLDGGVLTGAARAALLREMRAAAEAARKGASAAAGKLDELRRRREQRTG